MILQKGIAINLEGRHLVLTLLASNNNNSQPIKFAHLQKLANQLTLNGAHVIEITKTCTVTFMKGRDYLVLRYREKSVNLKKKEKIISEKVHASLVKTDHQK